MKYLILILFIASAISAVCVYKGARRGPGGKFASLSLFGRLMIAVLSFIAAAFLALLIVLPGCAPRPVGANRPVGPAPTHPPRVTVSDDGQGLRRETRTDTGVTLERVPK